MSHPSTWRPTMTVQSPRTAAATARLHGWVRRAKMRVSCADTPLACASRELGAPERCASGGPGHQLQGRIGWGNSANGTGPHSNGSSSGAGSSDSSASSSNGSTGGPAPASKADGQGKGSDMYYIAPPEFTGGPGNREVHAFCSTSLQRGLVWVAHDRACEIFVAVLQACAEPGACVTMPLRRACWCAAGGTAPSCWRCCASWTAAPACCPRCPLLCPLWPRICTL